MNYFINRNSLIVRQTIQLICFCSIPKQNQVSRSMRIQNTWLLLVNTLSQTIVVGTAIGMQEKVPLETAERLAWCHITSSRPDDKVGAIYVGIDGHHQPSLDEFCILVGRSLPLVQGRSLLQVVNSPG